jgi:CRP-like cAMP-binding protein
MNVDQVPIDLSKKPFFHGMSRRHLELLLESAEPRVYQYGDYLVNEGDPANDFFILLKGKVELEQFCGDAGSITLEKVSAGSVIGWSFIVPPHNWRLSARAAASPTEVLHCDAERIRGELQQNPEFKYQMLRRLARVEVERLTAARQALRITA